jgi:hypothetical protein
MIDLWLTDPAAWRWLLLVHAASTWFMTGLIWFVQVVHYPLFGGVGAAAFTEYERVHQRRTTWVVAPVMLIELVTAVSIAVAAIQRRANAGAFNAPAVEATYLAQLAVAGLVLLGVVWVSTWALQVPAHVRLANGFDVGTHRRLVVSNWVRTLGWSVRGAMAFMMLA